MFLQISCRVLEHIFYRFTTQGVVNCCVLKTKSLRNDLKAPPAEVPQQVLLNTSVHMVTFIGVYFVLVPPFARALLGCIFSPRMYFLPCFTVGSSSEIKRAFVCPSSGER